MVVSLTLQLALLAPPTDFRADFQACEATYIKSEYAKALTCLRDLQSRATTPETQGAKPTLQVLLANALFNLERFTEARRAYRVALNMGQSDANATRIRVRLKALDEDYGAVLVDCPRGQEVALSQRTQPCPAHFTLVPKGEAALQLMRDGQPIKRQTAMVVAQQQTRITIVERAPKLIGTKPAEPKPVAQNTIWKSVLGYSLIGVGVGLGGLGFYYADQVDEATEERKDELAKPDGSAERANSLADDAESSGDLRTAAWIAGGSLVAVGLGFVIWDAVDDEAPEASAWIGPGSAGISVQF